MDIALLSRMVGELILTNDRVGLPEMGFFEAVIVPASFSDKGYTINPPYRRLSFVLGSCMDNLISDLYASSNGISNEEASSIIVEFTQSLKTDLQASRLLEFPGLGRLKVTKDGQYLFIPDEDLDIYPEGAGLAPVSLKSHSASVLSRLSAAEAEAAEPAVEKQAPSGVPQEVQTVPQEVQTGPQEELQSAVAETSSAQAGDEFLQGGNDPESAGAAQESNGSESVGVPQQETRKCSRMPVAIRVLIILLIVLGLMLGAFLLLAKLTPDFIDSILYTEEELEILRWPN